MKIRKINKCFVFVLTIFILLNILIIFSSINKEKIQNDIFRLHIIANSNSAEDQKLKLSVAKTISDYLYNLYNKGELSSKQEAKKNIIKNIDQILEIAKNTISENDYNYNIYANIGKIKYDEKTSKNIDMDEGTYDSVKIVIGKGKGQNFWSLIYPYSYVGSYEFKDNTKNINENVIVDTNYILNEENITYEFKIVEWLKDIF